MSDNAWGKIQPEIVSTWMNFDRDNEDWSYDAESTVSMAAKQAEGVAHLWNTLGLHDVAILADEVGMGKTFQALGVACLLWKMKPEAKILVMAPNKDICLHWMREYNSFLEYHYREQDHLVRNVADGGPVHKARMCRNLDDLLWAVKKGNSSFFFTTIHSLSGLVKNKEGNLQEKAKEKAEDIHCQIKEVIGPDGFDLVIIDEAHKFRKRTGSQKASAAKAFFGEEGNRLGKKSMLLTATPSHSGLGDVANILRYFTDLGKVSGQKEQIALLEKYALRRLRLMKGLKDGEFHNKHHYRNEQAVEANFENNPKSELFFALYQRKLVKDVSKAKNGKRFLYGYLEGFESVGVEDKGISAIDEGDGNNDTTEGDDHKSAVDTGILKKLTQQYVEHFKEFPEHPKYSVLVEDLTPKMLLQGNRELHDDKHLVFVRRIPSVRELTQRVNLAYDHLLIKKILDAWGVSMEHPAVQAWKDRSWSREGYSVFVKSIDVKSDDDLDLDVEESDSEDDAQDSKLSSRVSNLFVVKKGKGGTTHASNVSLRFRKPESLFAMFMEPASDYKTGEYLAYYKKDDKKWKRDFFATAAKDVRIAALDTITCQTESADIKGQTHYQRALTTAWGLMYPLLDSKHQDIIDDWLQRDSAIVENFSNYLKSGFLFASPVIVELYCWFIEFDKDDKNADVQEKYLAFIEGIKGKLADSLMLTYFKNALETFESICNKVTDHKLNDWETSWRVLTSLNNPAWYASGETGNRQRLILGFNSPFYPNVLMATSVFQEGVNLHLQCNKVHHYGVAWSPGDNEQRVGRVDRLFGKVNQQLTSTGKGSLDIRYPYLKSSFDEDQVGSFIQKKHGVEEKMDFCIPGDFSNEIKLTPSSTNWREFLRTPAAGNASIEDPYPAKTVEHKADQAYRAAAVHEDGDIIQYLNAALTEILDADKEFLFKVTDNSHNPNALFLLDPILETDGIKRRQPVLIERHFSPQFSSLVKGTVYYLTLKTPIASKDALSRGNGDRLTRAMEIYRQHEASFPLVQLAVDNKFENSHFYCHMKVDLPLFVKSGQLNMLSVYEIYMAFEQIKLFADLLERILFLDNAQDLKKEDLIIFNNTCAIEGIVKQSDIGASDQLRPAWAEISTSLGDVAQLKHNLDIKELNEIVATKKNKDTTVIKLLKLNAKFPFLKFSRQLSGDDGYVASLSYPNVDFQEEEQELLERWFSYCLGLSQE